MDDALERWNSIHSKLPAHVSLVIVSKYQSLSSILNLAKQLPEDCRLFGENYQSEVIDKLRELADLQKISGLKIHIIGHLQSNKVRKLFAQDATHKYISCIETISSIAEADFIDKVLATLERHVDVFVQINLHGFEQQSGCSLEKFEELMFHLIDSTPRLRFVGLMCIADRSDPAASYSQMADLRLRAIDLLKARYNKPFKLKLSMGMSDDYELALAHGTDEIRIGTAIMGSRNKTASAS